MADVFTALVGAIENCIGPENCQKCEYRDIRTKTRCKTMLLRDALELLKAQESVEPILALNDGEHELWQCGNCKVAVFQRGESYCHNCGRAVKWE